MRNYDKAKRRKKRKTKKYFKILAIIFLVVAIGALTYCLYNFYLSNKNKSIYKEISYTETKEPHITVNMQKVANLKEENGEVIGWIQIEDTLIDYPILQASDNSYYLRRNYKKEKSRHGSIFTKNECSIYDNNSNLILYGHNMKDKQMFNNLLKYEDFDFYKNHNTIKISTDKEENEYKIVTVFKSRVFYQDEKDVFRYYNYTNFDSSDKYNEFIRNCKELQLYDTGVSAEYGEKLITLITCEYSQENGRLVVVAKKI